MTIFGNLPTWAVVLLCLLAAGILAAQNLGWLLQARALLDGRRRPGGSGPKAPNSEPEQRTGSSGR